MSPERKRHVIDVAYYSVLAMTTFYMGWVVWTLHNDRNPEISFLHWATRLCQSTAHTIGEWGMIAERKYYELLEQERMI